MTNFVYVSASPSGFVAIDSDGEIWILCGRQNEMGNFNLPKVNKDGSKTYYRDIQRPIQTKWMSSLGLRAIEVKVGHRHMLVMTEDSETGKKGVMAFK